MIAEESSATTSHRQSRRRANPAKLALTTLAATIVFGTATAELPRASTPVQGRVSADPGATLSGSPTIDVQRESAADDRSRASTAPVTTGATTLTHGTGSIMSRPNQQPSLVISDPDRALLSDRELTVVNGLLDIIQEEASRQYIRLEAISVYRFYDPDDDSDEIVISHYVPLPPRTAMGYWDRLGRRIDAWVETLPAALQRVAIERIAIDVDWNPSRDRLQSG